MTEESQVVDKDHSDLAGRLAAFVARNPEASVSEEDGRVVVKNPWGDASVGFVAPSPADELIEVLNQVRLPPRLSAIWHADTKDLEVIYTTLPTESELRHRSFEFRFGAVAYMCQFSDSSDRLRTLAEAFQPGEGSRTVYRNLLTFKVYAQARKMRELVTLAEAIATETPTSFWIRHLEWDEDGIVDLLRHLNFFTRYFDRATPTVLLHDLPTSRPAAAAADARYPFGPFPAIINARPVDPYLLGVWEGSSDGDILRRFIYSYQVLEYAAFYYPQTRLAKTIEKILASPSTPARAKAAARDILDVVAEEKRADELRLSDVIKEFAEPRHIWAALQADVGAFVEPTEFEGGHKMPAFMKPGCSYEEFEGFWIPKFPDAVRKLRNALVHSRDSRMTGVISPTQENYAKLRPWVRVLSAAAMDVMIYTER